MGITATNIAFRKDYQFDLSEPNPCADLGHTGARMIDYTDGMGRYLCRKCNSIFTREPTEVELAEYRGRTRRLVR